MTIQSAGFRVLLRLRLHIVRGSPTYRSDKGRTHCIHGPCWHAQVRSERVGVQPRERALSLVSWDDRAPSLSGFSESDAEAPFELTTVAEST